MSRTNREDRSGQMPLRFLGIVHASRQRIAADGSYERIDLEWDTSPAEDAAGDVDAQMARLATGTDDAEVETTEPYQLPSKEGE